MANPTELTGFASGSSDSLNEVIAANNEAGNNYGMKVWLYVDTNEAFTNWDAIVTARLSTASQAVKNLAYDYSTYTLQMECNISQINS